jgi:hypothetical protein
MKFNFFNKRKIKWWFQKRIRGFSDSELWDLTTTISKFIIPRLEEFKPKTYPYEFKSGEEWDLIIKKMIWSFKFSLYIHNFDNKYIKDMNFSENDYFDKEKNRLLIKKYKEGIKLFSKYYMDLWS